MTSYRKGYELENRVVNALRDNLFLAIRTSGSHSPIDVVAVSTDGDIHFIQLKRTSTDYFDKKELKRFKNLNLGLAFKHFWVWKKRKGWLFRWSEDKELEKYV